MSDENQTPAPAPAGDQNQRLAAHIMAEAAKQGVKAEVKINPIPPHIAANILEFLRRVKSEGMEALAWVEAYTFMQQHVPQPGAPQGVPFNGLPPKQ
jgi:hypothetical protein